MIPALHVHFALFFICMANVGEYSRPMDPIKNDRRIQSGPQTATNGVTTPVKRVITPLTHLYLYDFTRPFIRGPQLHL